MPANHETTDQTCPICTVTATRRVRCSNEECPFVVITCPRCDREQVVGAFLADHEKDCIHSPVVPAVTRAATFVAPRHRAA